MLHVGHGDVAPGHGLSRVGLAEMPGRNVMTSTRDTSGSGNHCYRLVKVASARVTAYPEVDVLPMVRSSLTL